MRSEALARLAVQSLNRESGLRGKPGLVCPGRSGSHADMDYELFLRSSDALFECFAECARAGADFAQREDELSGSTRKPLSALLPRLRIIGMAGERSMYAATGGVNTHKGAVFSLGLLVAAAGYFFGKSKVQKDRMGDRLCLAAGELCSGLTLRELKVARAGTTGEVPDNRAETNGARQYELYGTRGARGQAEDGYPIIRNLLLPILRSASRDHSRMKTALLNALLSSIAELDDTCILARGGPRGLEFAQRGAKRILEAGGAGSEIGAASLEQLDAQFCLMRLSPGGSADLLAATIFLESLEMRIAAINNGAQRPRFVVAESQGEYA